MEGDIGGFSSNEDTDVEDCSLVFRYYFDTASTLQILKWLALHAYKLRPCQV